jgi:hypothetical protein
VSTSWTLLASEVCTDALQHMGVLGEAETASGDQMTTALRGLDVVLKELPLAGYAWPKLSAEAALVWAGVQAIALPADYYGYPTAWKTLSGQKLPLSQIAHATWVQMPDRAATGPATHFYIDPAGVFNVWPVPAADPVIKLQYQKIVDDADEGTSPDVLQTWKGALGWGVADELGMKFGVPASRRVEINQRWLGKRALALASSIASEPISFEVRD